MANINILAPKILKWEGGFVNDPEDPGGATNKGITINTFRAFRMLNKLPMPSIDDLKNISDQEWASVLKTFFWDKWMADQINNQSIADILVDWFWASGAWAVIIPQRLLNVPSDGIVGNGTLTALNSKLPSEIYQQIFDARIKFINDIVAKSISDYEKKIGRASTPDEQLKYTLKKFQIGWFNRLNDFKFEA